MKILLLSEYFYPFDRGGSEWSVFYLAKALVNSGQQVEVFTPNYGSLQVEVYEKVRIYRFPFYKKLNAQNAKVSPFFLANPVFWLLSTASLYRRVRKVRPDVIHIQGKYLLPMAVIVGKFWDIPTVVTLRDFIPLCPFALCITSERKFRVCTIWELFTHDVPRYISQYLRAKTISMYLFTLGTALYGKVISYFLQICLILCTKRIGISHSLKKIYEINGIPIDEVIYNTMDFSPQVPTNRSNVIVFVGRLTPGKGVKLLVEAYITLAKLRQMPKLEIIGEGQEKERLTRLSDQIIFRGHQSYEKVIKAISRARLAIVPSLWEEPFGRVALEALSLGTPVIATNRGALPEIVDNGVTGIVVEPTIEGIKKGLQYALTREKKLRQNIFSKRLFLIQKFSKNPLTQYISLYRSIV